MIPHRRLLALRTVFYLSLVVTGKEILLISMSSDSLQFADADSTQKFVVVVDEVDDDALIVHRSTGNDKRSFAYPIAHIRRVTYLFGRRPYKRIVVEMF